MSNRVDRQRDVTQSALVVGELDTTVGPVPRVSFELTSLDRLGSFKARWGIGRMSYKVAPGLYALGSPDSDSPVLVTANYKMSFDRLRSALPGRDAWILVLQTFGINVWCAAGKRSFGTDELVRSVVATRLEEVVGHRRLIVPQLGAPGVAAHLVKERCGFNITYGPIRASDLPEFLDAGNRASPEMRRQIFPAVDRAVLIPMELVPALKPALPLAAAFFFLSGLGGPGTYWDNVSTHGLLAVCAVLASVLGGAVLLPLLLPWLPGRAFSTKGLTVGLVLCALVLLLAPLDLSSWNGRLEAGAWLLIVLALTTHLALNFTGASTYTSLSGVKKELRLALPAQIGSAAVGLVLWVVARVLA